MNICAVCNQETKNPIGCTLIEYDDFADGIVRDRIRYGHEADEWSSNPCHDCGAPKGTYHHPGCDAERCPKCQGQAISCNCELKEEYDED